MENSIILSIIIPAYERVFLLKKTLESIHSSIQSLNVEIIIVDDGSLEPIEPQLLNFLGLPLKFIRQNNQGCVVAKYNGLGESQGKYVLFVDSDDIVHPDKLIVQIENLQATGADICYTDEVTCYLDNDFSFVKKSSRFLPEVTTPAELYIKLQPCSSNLIYRRDYLIKYLQLPLIREDRIFGAIGEVWLYYNLAIYPAKIIKVNLPYSIYVEHIGRLTSHWEKLGISALTLMISFIKYCPPEESTLLARRLVGEAAFSTWRKLPKNFNPEFESKMLDIWKQSPKADISSLGGKKFQIISKILGIYNTAWIRKNILNQDYYKIKTISSSELDELMKNSFEYLNLS